MTTSLTEELILLAQKGDQNALTTVYNDNKKLIYALLKRYHYDSDEQDDLFSSGSLGLIKAIQNYDSSFNVKFSTYAVPLILGEIRKYFREQNTLKVSRGLKESSVKINQVISEYSIKNGREPTYEEIASITGLSQENVMLAIEASYKPTSLDKSITNDNEDISLKDLIASEDSDVISKYLDLDIAMSILDSKEKLFIHLRYFENMTQSEIAERLFTSQVNVSRLEKKILAKMKEKLLGV